ncbi:GNAT family N-acetyltransferase [Leucobacter sp. UCMA 4100]|uniref:GNAT family N-acetyltransferase n=1 Tax=Leucobacter sp. UCMA 4100 TaxID=2810534 RepID=UPI0022EA1651|nr:GNAT family N-acetyltransferase [Leucobacter sp. UCMA 4100]MDA3147295.1 GNAT family N-acetyltransferase [Leucobacter sp. UCMA 4100]
MATTATAPDERSLERALEASNAYTAQVDAQLAAASAPLAADAWFSTEHDETTLGAATFTANHPNDFGALWGALETSQLTLLRGASKAAAGDIIDQWIEWSMPQFTGTLTRERACEITLPSRDSAIVQTMLDRGFSVTSVTGVRSHSAPGDPAQHLDALAAQGITLRQAAASDAGLIAEMDVELLTHDSQHGGVSLREGAGRHLQGGIQTRLTKHPEWTWIIEHEGAPIGYLSLEIDEPRHVATLAPGGRIAYIQAMYLRPSARGSRVGESVTLFAHALTHEAGIERGLLGYAALNPRSGPFWCRMGYRPLLSTWHKRV